MNLHSRVNLEVTKGENSYQLYMPFNAPAGEAYDALFEMLQEVLKMARNNAEKMERKEEAPKAAS